MDTAGKGAVNPHKMTDALGWFNDAATAIQRATYGTMVPGHWDEACRPGDRWVSTKRVNKHAPKHARAWHCELQGQHKAHAAVVEVLRLEHRPINMHALVLEWPSLSTDMRLGYTQMYRDGTPKKVRTVTTPGRFLKRHWPNLADDVIRDVVARVCAQCDVWHTTEGIVRSVQEGPKSCMQWNEENENARLLRITGGKHPYMVYAPKYGWRAVVRIEDGRIVGRCLLLMEHRGEHKPGESLAGAMFVRTYKRDESNGYSYADEAMDAFLKDAGALKLDGWPEGALLLKTSGMSGSEFLAPYIDGENNRVDIADDDNGAEALVISGSGGYECDSTTGGHSDIEDDCEYSSCEDCEERAESDDGSIVGRHESRWVCHNCAENYVSVTGHRQCTYMLHEDNVVRVHGYGRFDVEFLECNDIIELEDGEYAHMDNAFCCAIDEKWYNTYDGVTTEDQDGLVHTDNTWTCTVSGDLWSNAEAHETLENGDWCHADNMPDEGETAERGIEATGLLFPKSDARVLGAEQKAQAVMVSAYQAHDAVQAEAASSRERFTGPPPSIGWWRTTHADYMDQREEWHLYRYWDGARWSVDCRSGESALERSTCMCQRALTPQSVIEHTRTRAPWDRGEPGTPVTALCGIGRNVATNFLSQAPPYDGWWNIMFARPSSPHNWANEYGLVIAGQLTHHTTSTPANSWHRRGGASADTWWRNRHPTWWTPGTPVSSPAGIQLSGFWDRADPGATPAPAPVTAPAPPNYFRDVVNLVVTRPSQAIVAITEELP